MKAIILLSGGLDSTVMLAMAAEKKRNCHALSFDYGQRHKIELKSATAIAKYYGCSHRIIHIDPQLFAGSALVHDADVPKNRTMEMIQEGPTPSTYVPARNTLFLAYAASQAEIMNAEEIYYGPNALDCIPYPDCRLNFVEAFQQLLNVATKQAIDGFAPRLVAPLLHWNKEDIINEGLRLKVPLHLTHSCYDPVNEKPCHACDACLLRQKAFATLGFKEN
jgi:7-cyano-7-deazaguanine synthase